MKTQPKDVVICIDRNRMERRYVAYRIIRGELVPITKPLFKDEFIKKMGFDPEKSIYETHLS